MNKILNITKWIFNPFLVKKPGQIKVVVLCIIAATTFWFLNAFNKTYTTVFSYPLVYNYDSDKFIPVENLKPNVDISITGQGWDLLKEAFSIENKKVVINLNELPGTRIIDADQIMESSNEILSHFQINRVFADSIKCIFDYKVNKLVKLKLPVDSINLSNGYAIVSDVKIEPKEIYLTGAASVLNEIGDEYFIHINEEIDDDFDDEVELDFPSEIKLEKSEVNVQFDIVPYVELKKKLSYDIIGKYDTNLRISPKKLLANIYVPEIYEDSIVDSLFKVELNLDNFKYIKDTFVKPKLTYQYKHVKKIVLEDSLILIQRGD